MDLGQRLRQARMEAGLSQRQLCGDEITRNMLSQIENGNAKPSMTTLRYLAAQLGKPVAYFLEEDAVTSPNQQLMDAARQFYKQKGYSQAQQLLQQYRGVDTTFDGERYLLGALCAMELAKQAMAEGKEDYAWQLLEQASAEGEKSPYYTPELERSRLALCCVLRPEQVSRLPEDPLWVLGQAELEHDPVRRGMILDAFPQDSHRWNFLRAEAWFGQNQYEKAARHYALAQQDQAVFAKLEICYRELGDYKQAYTYACLQKG